MTRQTRCEFDTTEINGHLSATLLPEGGVQKDDLFYTYLLKGGQVLQRSATWTTENDFSWELTESGLYSIQGHIKRGGVNTMSFSHPILFLNRSDADGFNAFINGSVPEPVFEDVFHASYPYADFLLISGGIQSKEQLELFAADQRLETHILDDGSCIMANTGVFTEGSNCSFVFSGSCFHKRRLLFGLHDVNELTDILRDEPTGNYTYLATDPSTSTVVCGSDYFGIAKLYYLEMNGTALVSNSYHLLLLLASSLGVKLSLDPARYEATFAFATMQAFHQNFTHQMEVSPVRLLPVDKRIHVKNGKIQLHDTSLRAALENQAPFDPLRYEELLLEAKDEILANVRSVLEHPSFNHVVTDLSGGLDSRLVFSAVTNFPDCSERVRINSHYSAAEPNDLKVAQEVSSLYSYKFDALPREKVPLADGILGGSHWSYNLGSYYSYRPVTLANRLLKTARLNGFYGEICARPYYSRTLFGTELDIPSVDEFCKAYFDRHRKSALTPSKAALDRLHKLFSDELKSIPGRSALEKMENHYLFFRNGLHCSDRFRSNISCPEFGPIQSKALFAAKRMGYDVFRSAKTQLDIINLTNPVLASLRYESPRDNAEREQLLQEHGLLGEPWSSGLMIEPRNVEAEWREAKDQITEIVPDTQQRQFRSFALRYRTFESDSVDLALACLSRLHHAGILNDLDTVRSLWLHLTGEFGSAIRWNVINRVVSLYIQAKICRTSEGDVVLSPHLT
ncbi:hypothetical protein [Nitratireductor aestuarii]|uniref:hypothetical protein n=1 Tax=Nitratireductor aestuarii TaxID=1735103 RepID=UPI001669C7B4|nr:hypothetical protein [Nitratireductor aestuarii]